jgi:hypothetical protein
VFGGSDVIATEVEELLIWSGAQRKYCAWPADLSRFTAALFNASAGGSFWPCCSVPYAADARYPT